MQIYRLTLTPDGRTKLQAWLRSMLMTDMTSGDDRTLCETIHAMCITDADAIELPRHELDRLQTLVDTWGIEQGKETAKEVGRLCSLIVGILWKPPHRVTEDVTEAVAGPVADRQKSLF